MKYQSDHLFLTALISIVFSGVMAWTGSTATIHVPGDYPVIQDAIDAAQDSDTVLIADGTYTGYGNREINFLNKKITVRSENGPENCVIDCEGSPEHPYRGFCFLNNETQESILEGLTIQNGFGDAGGAIMCFNPSTRPSPAIINCRFMNNSAEHGGGAVYCYQSSATFTNCWFENNISQSCGAFESSSSSWNVFHDCTFLGNKSGAFRSNESAVELFDCEFTDNSGNDASAVFINPLASPVEITNCVFKDNANKAIYITSGEPVITGCTFTGNRSSGDGAAMNISCSATVTQCTFTGNETHGSGGAICCGMSPNIVIGGSLADANYFSGNRAAAGADIFAVESANNINATCNHFSLNFESDYCISPQVRFDLTGCQTEIDPILQDVYVSSLGDDGNTGLDSDHPFKTLAYAMSRAYGTAENPVTVHLAEGLYSPSATGEWFPIAMVPHVSIRGDSVAGVLLDAEQTGNVLFGRYDSNLTLSNLTITGGAASQGGGILCWNSDPVIENCIIRANHAFSEGGGIRFSLPPPAINNCKIMDNTADLEGGGISSSGTEGVLTNCIISNNAAQSGGGVYVLLHMNLTLNNCLIIGNSAQYHGGGIDLSLYSQVTLNNCTLAQNVAVNSGGGSFCSGDSTLQVNNSILWDNEALQGPAVYLHNSDMTVDYSDVQGSQGSIYLNAGSTLDWGEGMIDLDPLFVKGQSGDYYLSQTDSGQSSDSPCVDSGMDTAENTCFNTNEGEQCMDLYTTRTDSLADMGAVDMGYHATMDQPEPTPTQTPEPTATPGSLGVNLTLSETLFHPDDRFLLEAEICNPGPETYEAQPLAILLDVNSIYFWYPGWTEQFMTEPHDIGIGSKPMIIMDFEWPDVSDSMSGIVFYGALLNYEFTEILGEWDWVSFGWEE